MQAGYRRLGSNSSCDPQWLCWCCQQWPLCNARGTSDDGWTIFGHFGGTWVNPRGVLRAEAELQLDRGVSVSDGGRRNRACLGDWGLWWACSLSLIAGRSTELQLCGIVEKVRKGRLCCAVQVQCGNLSGKPAHMQLLRESLSMVIGLLTDCEQWNLYTWANLH